MKLSGLSDGLREGRPRAWRSGAVWERLWKNPEGLGRKVAARSWA